MIHSIRKNILITISILSLTSYTDLHTNYKSVGNWTILNLKKLLSLEYNSKSYLQKSWSPSEIPHLSNLSVGVIPTVMGVELLDFCPVRHIVSTYQRSSIRLYSSSAEQSSFQIDKIHRCLSILTDH